MNSQEYLKKIQEYKIEQFGFDTHSRVLDIPKNDIKILWNQATNCQFKRIPRTEYVMRSLPEFSTKFKPYWRLELPDKYLMFYMTPTSPLIVPNGLLTDKGSIPFLLQNIISNYDREMMMAFLFHDVESERQKMTRFMTDNIIYEVGDVMGASWIKNNLVYTGVRLGNRYGKKDKIINDFNISEHNRQLIENANKDFIQTYYSNHLTTLENLIKK